MLVESHPKTLPQRENRTELRKDLSTHHFKMGNDVSDFKSVFTATIGDTGRNLTHTVERKQNRNSKTNFVLGLDRPQFETT